MAVNGRLGRSLALPNIGWDHFVGAHFDYFRADAATLGSGALFDECFERADGTIAGSRGSGCRA